MGILCEWNIVYFATKVDTIRRSAALHIVSGARYDYIIIMSEPNLNSSEFVSNKVSATS